MMEFEKNDPVLGDMEEDTPKKSRKERLRDEVKYLRGNLPQIAVFARYLLPLLTLLTLFVMGWFYNVRTISIGIRYHMSLWRLYGNTLTGTHTYLGGKTEVTKTTFYGLLSVGAIVGIFLFLLAAFLAILAAVTAIRAFRAGEESEESNRMKLIFKIAFPNRVCLFLSNALLLIPTLYPHFVTLVGTRFLAIGGEKTVFVLTNPVLITVGVLTVLTLVLAICCTRYERRCKMNMFAIYHAPDPDPESDEEE